MTVDETRAAGTPEDGSGDAGEDARTTVAPDEGDRNAEWKPGITREEFLAMKANAERANQLEAELAERNRGEQPPGATRDEPPAEDDDWRATREWAAGDPVSGRKPDPVARTQIRLAHALILKEQRDAERERVDAELDDIEDATERRTVRKRYLEIREKGGTFDQARTEIKTKKLADELAEANARLKQYEDRSSPRDAVRLPPREVSSSESKVRKMTYAQFDREEARIRQEQGDLAAMIFKDQIAKNKIDFTD